MHSASFRRFVSGGLWWAEAVRKPLHIQRQQRRRHQVAGADAEERWDTEAYAGAAAPILVLVLEVLTASFCA